MPDDMPNAMPDARTNDDSPTAPAPDAEVVAALDGMVTALEAMCQESRAAAEEATELRERSLTGAPLRESLRAEVGPALVQRVSVLQRRLADAASRLRRVHARRLHHEGLTTEDIAEIFGVSRQRISTLLRERENSSGSSSSSS